MKRSIKERILGEKDVRISKKRALFYQKDMLLRTFACFYVWSGEGTFVFELKMGVRGFRAPLILG